MDTEMFVEEQQHIYISRFKTWSFLGIRSPALESKRSDAKILQSMWPCVSIQYWMIPIPILDTTTPEPGIGSVDTWYLVAPALLSRQCTWISSYACM